MVVFSLARSSLGAIKMVTHAPLTTAACARLPAFAILNWNVRSVAVVLRTVSGAPAKEPTDLARPGSRSTAAPAGVVLEGQASVPDFCAPGLTTTRVLTGFSKITGPGGRILRQARATVTRVGSFVAGLPNRNAYARSPTGRTLRSVEPGPGRDTPALTATYPGEQVTVNPVIASEGRLCEAYTVGASTTWPLCARAAAATS